MTRVATVAFALMTALALPAFAQGPVVTPAVPVAAGKPMVEATKPAVPTSKAIPVAAKPADPTKKPVAAATTTTTAPVTKTP